uniref:Uncharacterized protein n=1 Tax=Candidatus Kentrum sp. DK TaxID=2126562 RepID=A0A450SWQ8_9GAMM|nr:MAG: hypothetical protein BECKDK2373B_GA0170837_107411 [Candidatus Kentron sp. DK]
MILLRKSPNQPSPGQNLRKSSLNSPLFASNLHKFWSRSRFPSRRTPKSDRLLGGLAGPGCHGWRKIDGQAPDGFLADAIVIGHAALPRASDESGNAPASGYPRFRTERDGMDTDGSGHGVGARHAVPWNYHAVPWNIRRSELFHASMVNDTIGPIPTGSGCVEYIPARDGVPFHHGRYAPNNCVAIICRRGRHLIH